MAVILSLTLLSEIMPSRSGLAKLQYSWCVVVRAWIINMKIAVLKLAIKRRIMPWNSNFIPNCTSTIERLIS